MKSFVFVAAVATLVYYSVWENNRWTMTILLFGLFCYSASLNAIIERIRRYIAAESGYDILAKPGPYAVPRKTVQPPDRRGGKAH